MGTRRIMLEINLFGVFNNRSKREDFFMEKKKHTHNFILNYMLV